MESSESKRVRVSRVVRCSRTWIDPVFKFFLRWLNTPSPGPAKRVCFSGGVDSNQPMFEEQSNNLEIGVIANNDDEGRLLLAVLRVIIDENPDLENWPYSIGGDRSYLVKTEVKDHELYSYLMSLYGDREETYFISFDISEANFSSELYGKIVTKNYSQVDLWTRSRLHRELYDLLDYAYYCCETEPTN